MSGFIISCCVETGAASKYDLRANLCRMARFGANISDAHSCFIFLPVALFEADPWREEGGETLILGGFHSLSTEVIETPRLERRSGLVGWVAEHRQSIHVSPFEHDSRTLGIYRSDQKLKSFIGIPITGLPVCSRSNSVTGVIACDSKKSFAFSKLQGKLLEDLSVEISNSINLASQQTARQSTEPTWDNFLQRGAMLMDAIGRNSVEFIRINPTSFASIESQLGTATAIALLEQFGRLVQQALPPHFPMYQLPNGDLMLALDNMMSAFYENKIRALAQHLGRNHGRLELQFKKCSFNDRQYRGLSLEELIRCTGQEQLSDGHGADGNRASGNGAVSYGNRRA